MKYKILVIVIFPLSEIVAKQFIVAILISKFVFVSQIKLSSPTPLNTSLPATSIPTPTHLSIHPDSVRIYIIYIWAENDKLNCIFPLFLSVIIF